MGCLGGSRGWVGEGYMSCPARSVEQCYTNIIVPEKLPVQHCGTRVLQEK